jgi:phosphoglycolate phosphatase-like HAD superfamily hydrolase
VSQRPLTAVIWDFDGTLVDSRRRNYNVVRRIIAEVTNRPLEAFPALAEWQLYDRVNRSYANWRDLYRCEFGFSEDETDQVGRMWTRYQMDDDTAAPVFDGVATVLAALGFVPHGIVSMNGRHQIARSLRDANLEDRFRVIVGWEDVDIRRQKPAPDGLLDCVRALTAHAPGIVLYLGDHETDVRCAHNARAALAERQIPVEIVTVAVSFTGASEPDGWAHRPDFRARHPHDVMDIARQALA